ncbi:fumarylacetoacetate hydrolase family protein [Psychrobacillus sp. FJAT-51614]|uniref:Fumarylacetoacetate hydrolase family protein n=1 Tax=Psychrobacillus mangrovi TaxID=3117745 RepID=A0ABU8F3Z7_9BACI
MKLVNFEEEQAIKLGIITEKGVIDIEKASFLFNNPLSLTMEEVISDPEKMENIRLLYVLVEKSALETLYISEKSIKIAPTLTNPNKIICVGLNYRKHAIESNLAIPTNPILFNKFTNSIAASNEIISLPPLASEYDFEAELAIVIGKEAKNISKEEALNYVFGYCNANDLSARDLQFQSSQWLLGKALDKFCPIGPYLVTADEIPNPNKLSIKTYYNGNIQQESNTADMIFHCDEIISYISNYITLSPGDIILTGTPEGVLMGLPEEVRAYMSAGDEVIIEIEGLGQLRNSFV